MIETGPKIEREPVYTRAVLVCKTDTKAWLARHIASLKVKELVDRMTKEGVEHERDIYQFLFRFLDPKKQDKQWVIEVQRTDGGVLVPEVIKVLEALGWEKKEEEAPEPSDH